MEMFVYLLVLTDHKIDIMLKHENCCCIGKKRENNRNLKKCRTVNQRFHFPLPSHVCCSVARKINLSCNKKSPLYKVGMRNDNQIQEANQPIK